MSTQQNVNVGDIVRFEPKRFARTIARQAYTNPEKDARLLADTYVVTQAPAANPTVAMRSRTTGNTIGAVRKALIVVPS